MNIIAGQYDIEAYQHETLELFISYVSDDDIVQDFSATYPGTTNPRFALLFSVRPKEVLNDATGSHIEDNDVIIDSINKFQIPADNYQGLDGSFENDMYGNYWLGKTQDSTPTVGQAQLEITPVTDPTNLTSTTCLITIPKSVMRDMEPGNYYYSLTLVEKSSNAIWWNDVFTGDATGHKIDVLMGGKFRVMASMNRDAEHSG
tara:strand:+ start:238 stop:846 length:609 start_codon:yes stop_codon:yes gene_type:complete